MDLVLAVRQYVAEMVRVAGPGMKVLLMDDQTTAVVSCVYAQSEIMQKEVFLFERLDASSIREPIRYLKCVSFVRPTQENLQLLARELKQPRYGQYYLYFSNVIKKPDVQALAKADEQESVRELHEYFADYVPLAPHAFSLHANNCYQGGNLAPGCLARCVSGIVAVLLSLRKNPMVRFQNASSAARDLAEAVVGEINKQAPPCTSQSSLFDFRQVSVENSGPPPLLLILDRRDDPVTPLLNQWTYQAMVHELIGIRNNRVNLADVPGCDADLKEVVLSPLQDEFYAKNLYANFGEIGQNIKGLMDDFQTRAKTQKKLESIADMKAFVEQYPQFRKISGALTKHVTLISELSRLTQMYNLLEVSEAEQLLACHDDHSQVVSHVRRLLSNDKVDQLDCTRLVMLYALHYERRGGDNELQNFVAQLRKRRVPEKYCSAVNDLLEFGGGNVRSSDLYGNLTAMAIGKKFIKGLKGVENIYTQHKPYVMEILDQLMKVRLRDSIYPLVGREVGQPMPNVRPQDIIVFYIGGITYEEITAIHAFNRDTPGVNVVLGGTCVHNSRSFIDEVINASASASRRQAPARSKPPLM